MNHEPQPPRNDAEEREWRAQERAAEAVRTGEPSVANDPEALRYRAMAHALHQPLDRTLPADFAQNVARYARLRTTVAMRFELIVSVSLLGVLIATMLGMLMYFGAAWLDIAQSVLPIRAMTNPWISVAAMGLLLIAAVNRLFDTRTRH
jgi:hypothetical protein